MADLLHQGSVHLMLFLSDYIHRPPDPSLIYYTDGDSMPCTYPLSTVCALPHGGMQRTTSVGPSYDSSSYTSLLHSILRRRGDMQLPFFSACESASV